MEEWKNAGFAGKEVDDQLWNEFNEARQKFYDRRSAAYAQIHERQQQIAEKKKELIEQAAAIVAQKEYNLSLIHISAVLHVHRSWSASQRGSGERHGNVRPEYEAESDED